MAKPLRPLIRSGGFYPSRKWTPLVYAGGYTTANGGGEPEPPPIEKTVTGNPIHITDALAKPAQALSVKLEPIQDLHGYDSPWPAGGGKNLLEPKTGSPITVNGVAFTFNNDGSVTITATEAPTGAQTYCGIYGVNSTDISILQPLISGLTSGGNMGLTIEGSAPGVYIITQFNRSDGTLAGAKATSGQLSTTVPSDAEYMFVAIRITKSEVTTPINCTVKLQITNSTATAWTPYSNICPIYGHTDADVTRTGKNLLDDGYSDNVTNTVVLPNGTYYAQAWLIENPSQHTTNPQVLINGTWQTVTPPVSLSGISISGASFGWLWSNAMQTITVTGGPIAIRYNRNDSAMATRRLSLSPVQLTEFSEYVGTTYPIPLGQTVYGGTLDVTTGKLTVDRAIKTFDGSEPWRAASKQGYYLVANDMLKLHYYENSIICDKLKTFDYHDGPNYIAAEYGITGYYDYASAYPNENWIYAKAASIVSDTAGFKQWLANNPITVCYELATPFTIQLTGQQVELLQGENNIWSDGEMTLVYLADGNASDEEALNILLGGRYVNNHGEDEPTDREALDIVLGGKK